MQFNPFLAKLIHNLNCGKSSPTMWATSVIFNKLARIKSPISPNLVALFFSGGGALISQQTVHYVEH
jgi:hypothetical protein